MYDLTGRVNNSAFDVRKSIYLSLSRSRDESRSIPLYVQATPLAPFAEHSDPDSISTLTDISDLSDVSMDSVQSGFRALQESLHLLEHKTDTEITGLRREIGRESSALYGLLETLTSSINVATEALIVNRKVIRNNPSSRHELLAAIPLQNNLPFSFLQKFSFRFNTAQLQDTVISLQINCTSLSLDVESFPAFATTIVANGTGYLLEGFLTNSFTGLELVLTSYPFVSSRRIPFDTLLTMELFVSCQANGALILLETILYPACPVKWK
jgi:hypothetical protein